MSNGSEQCEAGHVGRNRLGDMFRLKKPCSNCPFRTSGAIELRPGRLQGIVSDLLADDWSSFTCHKTLHRAHDDDQDSPAAGGRESMCAGAAIYLVKVGRPTVGMRLAHTLGHLNMEELAAHGPAVIDPLPESEAPRARFHRTR